MGNCVEIFGAVAVVDPQAFLPGAFESGIIPFALRAESIDALKAQTITVNGEAVVVGDGFVPGTASVFLTVVPVFMLTGTLACFGLAERAAIFLTSSAVIRGFAVLVHGKPGLTDWVSGWELFPIPGIAFVQWNDRIAVVYVFHSVVDVPGVVALVGDKAALVQRNDLICLFKYGFNHGGIGDFGGSGQLIERQTGNAVHQDVVFVTPVEFVVLFLMLI